MTTVVEGRLQQRLPTFTRIGVAALALLVATASLANTGTGPVVRLFPTTVLEDIRETGMVAEEMENNLQEVIQRLDLQQQLYTDSLCQGADGDQGCAQIAKQLGATYLEMLNLMGERLPDMERAVNSTRESLEARLRKELGQRTTPTTLQDSLLGKARTASTNASRPALRGRSGVRLSDRFNQYYKLVATNRDGPSSSLAVVAADIYLDMEEASRLIAATQEEISRATLMEQLNQSFGLITPEMAAVVGGVKEILFGESVEELPIADAPYVAGQGDFVSPLEM
ncbi:MAG: hypothetical protein AAF648_01490 [Pseudomonadota bacterium]